MASDIYWIDHPGTLKLAIMARPRAGDWLEDEVDHWSREGVATVLSLLEPGEVVELGLEAEKSACRAKGIEFRSYPIADRGLPDDLRATVQLARELRDRGRALAIHCRAGIGRSSLIAAAILQADGQSAESAIAAISAARGLAVPDTEEQRDWIMAFSQHL